MKVSIEWVMVFMDLIGSLTLILVVPYTNIDLLSYFQQAKVFLNGSWDYAQLVGE